MSENDTTKMQEIVAKAEGEAIRQTRHCGYGAALIATSVLLPAVAMVLTVTILLLVKSPDYHPLVPVWGTLGAIVAWLGLSRVCCKVADAQHANPSSYAELLPRLDELEAELLGVGRAGGFPNHPCAKTAYNTAVKQYNQIRQDLDKQGYSWVLGTGYITVWERLYRAEEAKINFVPLKKVLEIALLDEARLDGSDIPKRDDLLAKLQKAVVFLDPSNHKYLKPTSALLPPSTLAIGTTALPGGAVAVDYGAELLAGGGVPPYTWAVVGGAIPDALVLKTTGVLRGTPTREGHGSFTLQVKDSAGVSVEKHFDLLISPQTNAVPLTISTTTPLPSGTIGVEYDERLFAIGGTPPYRWKVVGGTIPDGMDLRPEGALRGRPLTAGTFEFEVEVADNMGPRPKPITGKFTLTIKPCGDPVDCSQSELNARGVLSGVRHAINKYRNSRWSGLIMARNHLLTTFMLTGMFAFAILAIAIMAGAEPSEIIAATVFYLVGATAGLCNRLRSESQAESGVRDNGLSMARLVTIPLFSGIAAIGGILFFAYLPFAAPAFAPVFSPPLTISTDSTMETCTLNISYATTLVATGGMPPYSFVVTDETKGAIPQGVHLSIEGVLSGMPTEAGKGDHFVVEVTDSAGFKSQKAFILPVKESPQNEPPKVAGNGSKQKDSTGEKTTSPSPSSLVGTEEKVGPGKSEQASGGTKTNEKPSQLEDIFNLKKNLIGIFVAAVFGLAPGLLLDRLQQQADRYKADLKSSQSTEKTQKS